MSFFTEDPKTITAKATDFTILYKINRETFLDIIK
jgi:hypothetical protein